MTTWSIPLFDTVFGEEELEAVTRPLRRGWLTMGEEVLALEEDLRTLTGARHAIAVSSCTTGLQLAYAAVGVGQGSEVVSPTLTFVATASAARSLGARVRLAESVGEDDLTVDPDSVRAQLTAATRAIGVVHYGGFPCRLDDILEIAGERGIPVIEDAAHAVFSEWGGRTLGLHGAVGCFSFYSNKNATCGEGGAVVTDDAELAERIRLLRSHGMTAPTLDRHRGIATSYDVVLAGTNARLDEMRAALLRVQLAKLPAALARRRELFSRYVELLADSPVTVPFTTGRFVDALPVTGVHIMSVLLPVDVSRAAVMAHLRAAGIQTSIHYPPLHRFRVYADDNPGLRATGVLTDRQLTLPLYPSMDDSQVEQVVATLLDAVGPAPNRKGCAHALA